MKQTKLISLFIIAIIIFLVVFFIPKVCSKTAGAIFEGTIIKECKCLGLTPNPRNPFAYVRWCYGIPISCSCQKWIGGDPDDGGKFVNNPCQ